MFDMEDIFNPVSSYKVTSEYDGVRLDNCLIAKLKGLPRTRIYSIIRKGEVRVNSSRSKPIIKLKHCSSHLRFRKSCPICQEVIA